MKFINTINWTLINVQEILKISHEEVRGVQYSYFHLKNGEEFDVYDCPNTFHIGEQEYHFDSECHTVINNIILAYILIMSENNIFDVGAHEEEIRDKFMQWAKNNKERLSSID